jgi:hypothetical protein
MDPIIDLAPGAEENALATEIAERIRDNLAHAPRKVADFRALRASVLMVAEDLAESFTLRFDHGRLTIHDGNVGIPWVTFCGDAEALRKLSDIPLTRFFRVPLGSPLSREGRETWRYLAALFARGDLKVYGLLAHPRTVFYLLRVLSRAG